MEVCILVKRDAMETVDITKDVATTTTVMTPCEVGEGTCARRLVADGDRRIGLQ
jgi:hypothetical protein